MTTVTLADAKGRLSALVEQAARGETVCITRRGKPIARITAIDPGRKRIDLTALRELTASMPMQPIAAAVWLRQVRDEERY
jgi:prevent-host-death family protein